MHTGRESRSGRGQNPACAKEVGYGKVQLWEGGPYWADRNIGADNPWDYGLYFWWGDTTGYSPSGTTFSFSFDKSNTPTYKKSNAFLRL